MTWLRTVLSRLQWLFAVPLTRSQQQDRAQLMAELDAVFQRERETRH